MPVLSNLRSVLPSDTFSFFRSEFNDLLAYIQQGTSVDATNVSYNGNTTVAAALDANTIKDNQQDTTLADHESRITTLETNYQSPAAIAAIADTEFDSKIGNAVTGNTENGVSVTWDNTGKKLNFDVNDPTISLSGDATGSGSMVNLGNTTIAVTLASVIAPGTYGTSTTYPVITVDAKGRVTSVTTYSASTGSGGTDAQAVRDVVGGMVTGNVENGIVVTYSGGTYLNFDVNDPTLTFSGDVTGSGQIVNLGNTTFNLTLPNTGVTAGTYGNSTTIPVVTVDAKGRVTSVGTQAVSATQNTLSSGQVTQVQDTVGAMVSSNTENGIAVTYDATGKKLNFDVNDFTVSLTGDATGTGTVTNLANASIPVVLASSGASAGTYGSTTVVPVVTVDAKGRVTAISNATIPLGNYVLISNTDVNPTANTVVRRDSDGHVNAQYFITQAANNGVASGSISQVFVSNSSDNYIRKASLANFATAVSSLGPRSKRFRFPSGGSQNGRILIAKTNGSSGRALTSGSWGTWSMRTQIGLALSAGEITNATLTAWDNAFTEMGFRDATYGVSGSDYRFQVILHLFCQISGDVYDQYIRTKNGEAEMVVVRDSAAASGTNVDYEANVAGGITSESTTIDIFPQWGSGSDVAWYLNGFTINKFKAL